MPFLSLKQQEYRLHADRVWNVKTGATRSGKTYGDYYLLPKRILGAGPGLNVLLGSTKGTLTRNLIQPMQAIYGVGLVGTSARTIRRCSLAKPATVWARRVCAM